ncbi:MAG: tRNA uridine-5-carboxymethylaminomethyl(34) synthesis GTPase MnmE [Desulfobacteraceae bacterium]|nr:tRNA uridine-5-carboxymethylaminomethyl(34) synthesis GTPase MnmE [Desulfobacteraceae bacterium]MBC2720654.1 tRNA uridine-5-carboxymethylaminomethyl(34) synthesis GTPase MnmE [Desulfobacteraceae bacterium]
MNDSTIAAVATPVGAGGIGIIKISGQNSLPIASRIFRGSHSSISNLEDKDSIDISSFKSHHLYHGYIVDPENSRVVDEVLLAVMLAPHSYTREDVVEIQAHSGPVVLRFILDLVLKCGATIAGPGEFTKRAYINGRIDLTQAEAVIDIINARTNKSLEIATTLIKGELQLCIERISDYLFNFLAEINAAIDFPEDVEEIINVDRITRVLQNNIINTIKELIGQYDNGHILRDGIKLVIVGKPNVGKSSLMNCLIKKERSIVTAVPGTTRDLIEESFSLRGMPIIIADTAGLHDTDDPVEVIGINKAKDYIDCSDLILFIIDAGSILTHEDHEIFKIINTKNSILVINKSDLFSDRHEVNTPDSWEKMPRVEISALYNMGLDGLKDLIVRISLGENSFDPRAVIIPGLRHKLILDQCLISLCLAVDGFNSGSPLELIAIDIQEAIALLGEITGRSANNDVIDQIFSRFCIGK